MFQQHWCKSKSRWSYRAVDVGRCPHLYTGKFRAWLVWLFQTGNPISALCGFLAALMAVIWSLSACGGTFAYIHPRTACTSSWLFFSFPDGHWDFSKWQCSHRDPHDMQKGEPSNRCEVAQLPWHICSAQEHWESSWIPSAILYCYHYDPAEKEIRFSSDRKHHKGHSVLYLGR